MWNTNKRPNWWHQVYRAGPCFFNWYHQSAECLLRISGYVFRWFLRFQPNQLLMTSFFEQILVNISATSTLAIQTIYGYCHVGVTSFALLYVQTAWLLLHMSITILIIYYSGLLTNEVKLWNQIIQIIQIKSSENCTIHYSANWKQFYQFVHSEG